MARPSYAALAAAYPRKPDVDQAMLYTSIGHPEYAASFAMQNTCAVRVSLALLGAGIVSFMGIDGAGSTQGHIDLVEPATLNDLQCASACYWSAAEVWFWPLR